MTRPSRRDLNRAAQILRLRGDARRARMHAASVTDADDLEFYRKLADEWEREADALEATGVDDPRMAPAGRRSR